MAVATTHYDSKAGDREPRKMTPLQRHVAFFDPEATGVITIGQTWAGLDRLGVGLLSRVTLTPIINVFLGYLTQKKVSLDIAVSNIADGKHPFDTGGFGDDGEIDEAALAKLFEAAGLGDCAALSAKEMRALIRARGNHRPQMGKVAGALGSWFSGREVQLLFCLAADATKREGGRDVKAVTPRTLRRLYNGTLFPLLARRRRIRARRAG